MVFESCHNVISCPASGQGNDILSRNLARPEFLESDKPNWYVKILLALFPPGPPANK